MNWLWMNHSEKDEDELTREEDELYELAMKMTYENVMAI
jgi:hypothetical protein